MLAKSLDSSVKEVAIPPAATPSRAPGEEKKTTQVIVKNNQPKKPSSQPPKEESQSTAVQQVNTGLVPALATAYKDEKRYALVVGNGNYNKDLGIQKNPVNDATDVARNYGNQILKSSW